MNSFKLVALISLMSIPLLQNQSSNGIDVENLLREVKNLVYQTDLNVQSGTFALNFWGDNKNEQFVKNPEGTLISHSQVLHNNGEDERGRRTIEFEVTFPNKMACNHPTVLVTSSQGDYHRAYNVRTKYGAKSITKYGFTGFFQVWYDTKAFRVNGNWMALCNHD